MLYILRLRIVLKTCLEVRLLKKNLWRWRLRGNGQGQGQNSSLWCGRHFRKTHSPSPESERGYDPGPLLPSTDKEHYFQPESISSTHTEGTQRHTRTDELLSALWRRHTALRTDSVNHVTQNVHRESAVGGQDRYHTQAHLQYDTRATYM